MIGYILHMCISLTLIQETQVIPHVSCIFLQDRICCIHAVWQTSDHCRKVCKILERKKRICNVANIFGFQIWNSTSFFLFLFLILQISILLWNNYKRKKQQLWPMTNEIAEQGKKRRSMVPYNLLFEVIVYVQGLYLFSSMPFFNFEW